MNAGLNSTSLELSDTDMLPDDVLLEQIKKDVARGYRIFCSKRGWDPDDRSRFRNLITASAREGMALREQKETDERETDPDVRADSSPGTQLCRQSCR